MAPKEASFQEFGKHYLVELIGCDASKISTVAAVEQAMLRAAKESNTTVLSHAFHQFTPHGATGYLFIAESHFAVHTWPESNYVALDIFTCGQQMDAPRAIEVMKAEFAAAEARTQIISRGVRS